MPSVILCRGQDQWLSEFLASHPGIQQHVAVTWWVPSDALDLLVADLCTRGGAEVIDWREHMLLTCALRDEVLAALKSAIVLHSGVDCSTLSKTQGGIMRAIGNPRSACSCLRIRHHHQDL